MSILTTTTLVNGTTFSVGDIIEHKGSCAIPRVAGLFKIVSLTQHDWLDKAVVVLATFEPVAGGKSRDWLLSDVKHATLNNLSVLSSLSRVTASNPVSTTTKVWTTKVWFGAETSPRVNESFTCEYDAHRFADAYVESKWVNISKIVTEYPKGGSWDHLLGR